MTANPFAALLDGVRIYQWPDFDDPDPNGAGDWYHRDDILTALAAAVPADLAEAGKVQAYVVDELERHDARKTGWVKADDYHTLLALATAQAAGIERHEKVIAALAAAVPADLAEAGNVLEGVTPGPWCVPGQPDKICAEGYTKNGFARTIATVATPSWMGSAEPWANARFIAWCREGVPALLARIAAQEAQIKGLEAENKNRIGDLMKLSHQMSEWKASQHYRYIGADGQPVLARDLEARAEAAETALAAERAKTAKLVEALEHEVKRSRRHLAASTLAALEDTRAAITEAGQ